MDKLKVALENRVEQVLNQIMEDEQYIIDFVDENGYLPRIFLQQHCELTVELRMVQKALNDLLKE